MKASRSGPGGGGFAVRTPRFRARPKLMKMSSARHTFRTGMSFGRQIDGWRGSVAFLIPPPLESLGVYQGLMARVLGAARRWIGS